MQKNRMSVSCAAGHSPGVEDLCQAMFIEGARVLGFDFDLPISLEAQAKILQAVNSLCEKLAVLLEMSDELTHELEIGN
jgi:hypothetical protein